MGLNHLDHYNIEVIDLQQTIEFYCNVLGLSVGYRPPLPTAGAWLYGDNGHPSVHLISRTPDECAIHQQHTGRLHHICFAATGKQVVKESLEKAGISFKTVVLPRAGNTQFFLQDPNGINVEINFPSEETTQNDRDLMARQSAGATRAAPGRVAD